MLWFKNAIVYEINKDTLLNKQAIEQAVNALPFTPCGKTDNTKSGWISPYGEDSDNPLLIDLNGHLLLRLKKEIKILPSSVIKQALNEKIAKQEEILKRKLKKTEKINLKDEVYIDLLPRAFSKYQYYWLWIDTQQKRIIIDTSNFKQAEEILAILRKELGVLAVIPFTTETPLEKILTKWVRDSLHFSALLTGDEIELQDALENNCTVKCKNQEVNSNEVFVHIDSGKQVCKLKLINEQNLSFILHRDCTIKRIKFDSAILDKNEDFTPEETEKRLEADFIIMAQALSETLDSLVKITSELIDL